MPGGAAVTGGGIHLLARKRRFPLTPVRERRPAPAPVGRPEMARQRE
ncbi:hypothetical protein MBH78_12635 [Oceanimonas sp. NS1]|nr:hypothetical protein [Oceanimonas sp. NS1]